MQLIYMGKDITSSCNISAITITDRLGDMCDSAEMCFDNPKDWLAWKPTQGDTLEWLEEGYTSGTLYVDEAYPKKSGYWLYAGNMPKKAFEKAWESYERITLFELLRRAAGEMGMEPAIYGTDGQIAYDRVVRRDENWMAFLHRMATCEGMWLKSTGKTLLMCSRAWAYEQDPARQYEIDDERANWRHRIVGTKLAEMRIVTPMGKGSAVDTDVSEETRRTMCGLAVRSDEQAARWARGMLTAHNERAETFTLNISLDTGLAAGCTILLSGLPLTAGLWLAVEVRHDLKKRETRVEMYRCITSVV